jgi:hypothetical protein
MTIDKDIYVTILDDKIHISQRNDKSLLEKISGTPEQMLALSEQLKKAAEESAGVVENHKGKD